MVPVLRCVLVITVAHLVSGTSAAPMGVVMWGVSNRWTGIWNGTVEWKMEWNGECTQL